ncbi:MAG TPA: helix-hairpin-helix domain-containing protein [Bacteroidales bacterium]|nr:helix-hairpin-helix domain-containing protein [Bacteroidales bacterium]
MTINEGHRSRITAPGKKISDKLVLISIALFIPTLGYSQESRLSVSTSTLIEELAADEAGEENIQQLTERISELIDDPVNLNFADENEISRLFFLTEFQVKALVDYIKTTGKIFSVFEIANIPGFDRETAETLIPFIILVPESVIKVKRRPSCTFLSSIILKPGEADTVSEGTPIKYLGKLKVSAGNIKGGLTMEKDNGEMFFPGKHSYPDFISGYMSYTGNGLVRNIVIGDFSSRFGMGSNLNTTSRNGLSLTSPSLVSGTSGFRGYNSADENSFCRGFAGTFGLRRFSLSMFYSENRVDATLTENLDSITSFYTGGTHNTPTFLLKKDAVKITTTGADLAINLEKIRMGILFTEDKLSLPVRRSDEVEKLYSFKGSENSLLSFYYKASLKKILFFGESTVNRELNVAMTNGLSMRISGRLIINLISGSITPGYSSLHGRSPVTGSSGWNEKSLYGNFSFEASKNLFINGGCLFVKYPWLKYNCSSPSEAVKQEVNIKYLPSDQLAFEGTYSFRRSNEDGNEENRIPSLIELRSSHFRGSFRYSPSEFFYTTTRIDYKRSSPGRKEGFAFIQDISGTFRKIPLTIWYRLSLFSAAEWETRIYAYENDLLYSYNVPALYGNGSRSSIMLKYKARNCEIRLKYGTMLKLAEGEVNNDQDLRVQVKMVF